VAGIGDGGADLLAPAGSLQAQGAHPALDCAPRDLVALAQ
jgi:hypothetical protein